MPDWGRIGPGPQIAFIVEGETIEANMSVSSKEKSKLLAEENSRTPEFEHGYVHGKRSRYLNELSPRYLILGIDDYAFGFRAGYFANVRMAPRAGSVGR